MAGYFEIDRALTERINRDVEGLLCDCEDCQRYYRYMAQLPANAKEFFEVAGLDPQKCQELWGYYTDEHGYTHYDGFFYIAVKSTPAPKRFSISAERKAFTYGQFSFRVRLSHLTTGALILQFDAALPAREDCDSGPVDGEPIW